MTTLYMPGYAIIKRHDVIFFIIYYIWGKVMFSEVFICSQGGGGGGCLPPPIMHHWSHDQRGIWLLIGGGGGVWAEGGRGGYLVRGGWVSGCIKADHPPPPSPTPGKDTMGYGQSAVGTHPTRMHSFFMYLITNSVA